MVGTLLLVTSLLVETGADEAGAEDGTEIEEPVEVLWLETLWNEGMKGDLLLLLIVSVTLSVDEAILLELTIGMLMRELMLKVGSTLLAEDKVEDEAEEVVEEEAEEDTAPDTTKVE